MSRITLALPVLLLIGCSSTPSSDLRLGLAPEPSSSARGFEEPGVLPGLFTASTTTYDDEGLRHSRTTIKGGIYSPEDSDELDDGWIANLSWMRFFTSLLAIEFEVGYFDADGEEGLVSAEVWGTPIMVNGRANIPLWILDLYGGVGVGTTYYDAEVSALGLTDEEDGFLLSGNAFVGATVNLADHLALGVEAKYYVTDDIDEYDTSLDAFALMATLGFSR